MCREYDAVGDAGRGRPAGGRPRAGARRGAVRQRRPARPIHRGGRRAPAGVPVRLPHAALRPQVGPGPGRRVRTGLPGAVAADLRAREPRPHTAPRPGRRRSPQGAGARDAPADAAWRADDLPGPGDRPVEHLHPAARRTGSDRAHPPAVAPRAGQPTAARAAQPRRGAHPDAVGRLAHRRVHRARRGAVAAGEPGPRDCQRGLPAQRSDIAAVALPRPPAGSERPRRAVGRSPRPPPRRSARRDRLAAQRRRRTSARRRQPERRAASRCPPVRRPRRSWSPTAGSRCVPVRPRAGPSCRSRRTAPRCWR